MTDQLPPLPEPARKVTYNEAKGYTFDAYTADQMHAIYAQGRADERASMAQQRPPPPPRRRD